MRKSNAPLRRTLRAAMLAAVYVALCLLLAPLAYGPVQVRLAEALCLLPVLCPEAVAAVTVGCFLANLFTGAPLDVLTGTLATLLAALCTRRLRAVRLRGVPLAAALPPVLFNAVVVGATLTWLYHPAGSPPAVWAFNMLTVGLGQAASCGLGLLLVCGIERQPALRRLFA